MRFEIMVISSSGAICAGELLFAQSIPCFVCSLRTAHSSIATASNRPASALGVFELRCRGSSPNRARLPGRSGRNSICSGFKRAKNEGQQSVRVVDRLFDNFLKVPRFAARPAMFELEDERYPKAWKLYCMAPPPRQDPRHSPAWGLLSDFGLTAQDWLQRRRSRSVAAAG
jgi:hypothetical protein